MEVLKQRAEAGEISGIGSADLQNETVNSEFSAVSQNE